MRMIKTFSAEAVQIVNMSNGRGKIMGGSRKRQGKLLKQKKQTTLNQMKFEMVQSM
jgi:hypothetical protein